MTPRRLRIVLIDDGSRRGAVLEEPEGRDVLEDRGRYPGYWDTGGVSLAGWLTEEYGYRALADDEVIGVFAS